MSSFSFIYESIPKLNKHGINIILIIAVIGLAISFFSSILGFLAFLIVLFSLYFFRDPERICLADDGMVCAPADGIVTSIEQVTIPERFGVNAEAIKISIFLNIFDVHVNRLPVNGTIKNIIYSPGKFINVAKEKESLDNESNTLIIEDKQGNNIVVTQIAGLIARRIVCDMKSGEETIAGERFGIIKFGSRVNIYLPLDFKILVAVGQKMIGGETLIATQNKEMLEQFIDKINKKDGHNQEESL